jgi:hypothetical protein
MSKNPVDAYLETAGETKTAAPNLQGALSFLRPPVGRALGAMKEPVMGAVINAGMSAALTGGAVAASRIIGAIQKGKQFRAMMDFNEDLHEYHSRDPKLFNQQYTSLRAMNPEFAADPLIAGTYMRRMSTESANAGGILTDALNFRDKEQRPVMDAFQKGLLVKRPEMARRPENGPPPPAAAAPSYVRGFPGQGRRP